MKTTDQSTAITESLQGRHGSFEILVNRYQSNVLGLALNILGNRDDALDIVQETFVQAFVNLDKFDRERNFKTWLLSIASKRCLDLLRKRKSFLNYFRHHSHDYEEQRARAFKVGKLEDSELFAPLLKKISLKERTALVLKLNENYSAEEIAQVLNCSTGTARVHLCNARKRMKKLLGKESGAEHQRRAGNGLSAVEAIK